MNITGLMQGVEQSAEFGSALERLGMTLEQLRAWQHPDLPVDTDASGKMLVIVALIHRQTMEILSVIQNHPPDTEFAVGMFADDAAARRGMWPCARAHELAVRKAIRLAPEGVRIKLVWHPDSPHAPGHA